MWLHKWSSTSDYSVKSNPWIEINIEFQNLTMENCFHVNFVLTIMLASLTNICMSWSNSWNYRFFAWLFVITGINKVEVNWLSFLWVKYGKSCNISNVYRSVADPQICLQSIIRWHGSQISTFWTPDVFGSNSSVRLRSFKWPLWKTDAIINMFSIKLVTNIDNPLKVK